MNIDANGLLQVEAEETQSAAKATYTINRDNCKNFMFEKKIFIIRFFAFFFFVNTFYLDSLSQNEINQHLKYVEIDRDFHPFYIAARKPIDSLHMVRKIDTYKEKTEATFC